jgi:hypothetical protein
MKRVSKVIKKAQSLEPSEKPPASLLSGNKVTGYSVNFPIASTCRPSKVCIETCYYAVGGTSWNASLRKQLWLMDYCQENPVVFAEQIVQEYHKKKLTYLRWNGGGDLFPASVDALNHIGENHPDVIIWIVTRIPEMASLVMDYDSLHLHFSLDKHSLERREQVLSLINRPIFFSYQCEKDEKPDVQHLVDNHGVSLFFFNNYYLTDPIYETDFAQYLCPLNMNRTKKGTIVDSCNNCKKCFSGHWLNS